MKKRHLELKPGGRKRENQGQFDGERERESANLKLTNEVKSKTKETENFDDSILF